MHTGYKAALAYGIVWRRGCDALYRNSIGSKGVSFKCWAHIKLASKVLHKIYIEINVYFMQDF